MSDGFGSLRIERQQVTLRQQVVDVLRHAILEERFKPGERLIERQLCDLTGVSRTSVREALRHLESEGLVRSVPNKGPVVSSLTLDEVRQIYEARETLESQAAALFTERASDGDLQDLRDTYARLDKALASGSRKKMEAETLKLYDILLDGSGNEVIASLIRSLHARVVYLRSVSMSHPGRVPHSHNEMKDLVAALLRRDAPTARKASARHVRAASKAALAVLEARNAGQDV
ncbi:MAG: GntR family transcriptional regulator [Pseudorhodoplanes sp.]